MSGPLPMLRDRSAADQKLSVGEYLDISIAFGIVYGPELGRALAVLRVRHEDRSSALSLRANHPTHVAKSFTRRRRCSARKEKEEPDVKT